MEVYRTHLPSKVNIVEAVPATAPTVAIMLASNPAPLCSKHDTVVDAIQDKHEQDCWLNIVVIVKSVPPKLKPLTVTESRADVAVFNSESDTTGAEKKHLRSLDRAGGLDSPLQDRYTKITY